MQPAQLLKFVDSWAGVDHDIKWGCDLVLTVGGKMFCITSTSDNPEGSMSFKVEDDRFLEMTDREGFMPAPYLARAKWIKVEDSRKVNGKELKLLIRRSYELVRGKLSRKLQKELTDLERGTSAEL